MFGENMSAELKSVTSKESVGKPEVKERDYWRADSIANSIIKRLELDNTGYENPIRIEAANKTLEAHKLAVETGDLEALFTEYKGLPSSWNVDDSQRIVDVCVAAQEVVRLQAEADAEDDDDGGMIDMWRDDY